MPFFPSDGVSLYYEDHAPDPDRPGGVPDRSGEPIVLVHGFASTHVINWVNTQWLRVLVRDGRRVILLDNRGHGRSQKLYDPEAYASERMAADVARLMDHLGLGRADVMGYSMGARITAHLAVAAPARLRSMLLGGLGIHLVEGVGLPIGIADAMEAPSLDSLTDPMQRMFRAFAEQTGSDLRALAACIRGTRQTLTAAQLGGIRVPTLVSVGTKDPVAGDPHRLAALIPGAEVFDIPGRDHNLAVGDRDHKAAVLAFLGRRP